MNVINQLKNRLLQLTAFLKSNRRLVIVITSSILIISIILLSSKKTSTSLDTSPPGFQKLSQQLLDQPDEPQAYLLNKVFTFKPTTGYSWSQNRLIYSTPKGIFVATNNQVLLKQPIDYISWSQTGLAILQINGQWHLFNSTTQQSENINFSGINPQISPDGSYLASINQQSLNLLNLNTKQSKIIDLPTASSQIVWSSPSNHLVAFNKKSAHVFNLKDLSITSISVESLGKVEAISPLGNRLAIAYPGTLEIIPVTNSKNLSKITFTAYSDLTIQWINQDWLIAIETAAPDKLGRKIDYLWKIINLEEKQLISTSMPIANRLNNQTRLFINPEKTILPLIEIDQTLWLLGLLPNQLPTYSETGFFFLPISTKGH